MKYVNKEFGIPNRPPQCNYTYESDTGFELDGSMFPDRVILAPGIDYAYWNGAMLVTDGGALFGVRVGIEKDGEYLYRMNDNAVRSGDYSCDFTYADMRFDNGITLHYAKPSEDVLLCRITAEKPLRAAIDAYAPFGSPSEFTVREGRIYGVSPKVARKAGSYVITGGHAQYRDRWVVVTDEMTEKCQVCLSRPANALDGTAFIYDLAAGESVTYTLSLDGSLDFSEKIIENARERYLSSRFSGSGELGRGAVPLMNEMLWLTVYFPFDKTLFCTNGRPWYEDGNFNIWGWDENFSGLIMSYGMQEQFVRRQFEISIGDERVGPLCLWTAAMHLSDRSLLESCYERSKTIYPPSDAALVRGNWGNGNVGKGMDDTPMREKWDGGEMWSLDMSCMKCWSLEVLGRIARMLGKTDEAEVYEASHAAISSVINDTFWNEAEGLYNNRYMDGRWPVCKGPTAFYPLLTGIVDADKLPRIAENLLDENKFWGKYVIPSLSKDDVEYGKPSRVPEFDEPYPPYCYWRGNIWAPTNYLVYQALKRAELDGIASEFAQKSVELWHRTWEKTGWCCENYDPETGDRSKMSHCHQSWTQLLPLIGVQELLDAEIWEPGSIMFGTRLKGANALHNMRIRGELYDLTTDDTSLRLVRNGRLIFVAEGAKCAVRRYNGHSFDLFADGDCTVSVNDEFRHRFSLSAGSYRVSLTADGVSTEKR